jgi:hypothetical protein
MIELPNIPNSDPAKIAVYEMIDLLALQKSVNERINRFKKSKR